MLVRSRSEASRLWREIRAKGSAGVGEASAGVAVAGSEVGAAGSCVAVADGAALAVGLGWGEGVAEGAGVGCGCGALQPAGSSNTATRATIVSRRSISATFLQTAH